MYRRLYLETATDLSESFGPPSDSESGVLQTSEPLNSTSMRLQAFSA